MIEICWVTGWYFYIMKTVQPPCSNCRVPLHSFLFHISAHRNILASSEFQWMKTENPFLFLWFRVPIWHFCSFHCGSLFFFPFIWLKMYESEKESKWKVQRTYRDSTLNDPSSLPLCTALLFLSSLGFISHLLNLILHI